MKFSCEKALLQSAIATTGRAVAPQSSIPALEGILVECLKAGLRLTGYDLSTGITTRVPADVAEQGAMVLSARLFGDIVRKLPDDVLTVASHDNNVHIACGPASFDIVGTDPREFPDLPEVDDGNGLVMTQGRMRDMIARTIFAVSDNESRPIHTGELFEVQNDLLTLVAVDGYRLAIRREPVTSVCGERAFSFVVPAGALSEVVKICGDTDEMVSITQGQRHITFEIGDTMLVARRLEGEFLNYRQTLPRECAVKVTAATRDLQASIERTSLIINEKLKSPVRCKFEDGSIAMLSRTALGSAFDRCPIDGSGGGLEIGFNNRFLMDAVRSAPADTVRLELNTPTSPCLVLPLEGDSFLYMILPVRLKAGD